MKLRLPDIATKWLLLLVTVELALASVLGYLLAAPSSDPRLPVENYLRIEHGMSRDEVVAILGEPSPDQRFASDESQRLPRNHVRVLWETDDLEIGVIFGPSGKVAWGDLGGWGNPGLPRGETPLERLKILWKRLFP